MNYPVANGACFTDAIGWQPMQSAPCDGTPVLLFVPFLNSLARMDGMPSLVVGLFDGEHWRSDVGDVEQGISRAYFVHEALRPTHWMPLPTPPPFEDADFDDL